MSFYSFKFIHFHTSEAFLYISYRLSMELLYHVLFYMSTLFYNFFRIVFDCPCPCPNKPIKTKLLLGDIKLNLICDRRDNPFGCPWIFVLQSLRVAYGNPPPFTREADCAVAPTVWIFNYSVQNKKAKSEAFAFLELLGRLELPTSSLPRMCSTT